MRCGATVEIHGGTARNLCQPGGKGIGVAEFGQAIEGGEEHVLLEVIDEARRDAREEDCVDHLHVAAMEFAEGGLVATRRTFDEPSEISLRGLGVQVDHVGTRLHVWGTLFAADRYLAPLAVRIVALARPRCTGRVDRLQPTR